VPDSSSLALGSTESTRRKGIVDTYAEPKIRTIKLRVALAVGAAAVAGALGVGYVLAQVLDEPTQVTVAVPAAAVHTLSNATAESLALKQRSPFRGKEVDVRYRRVITP
jgi:hypothetical protein